MTMTKYGILNRVLAVTVVMASSVLVSSCDIINEDLEECNQGARLRFIYDYNMEFANAFPSQVDCLTLLIYDEGGNFVTSKSASAPEISQESYRMNVDLPAGTYHFVAYGGMNCPESSFHFTNASTHSDVPDLLNNLEVEMNPDVITAPNGTDLHKLFYGDLDLTVPDDALDYIDGTVKMMRDTNDIRILLQQINGEAVEDDAFIYTVSADNTLFNYMNNVIPVNTTLFYPWDRGQVSVGENQYGSETVMAFAQFSLSRFTLSDRPTLTIRLKKDNKEVLSIPLIPYLLALKNSRWETMDNQEYLDRENSWDMIFFLDSNYRWINVSILINGYVVRINDIEF